MVLYLLEMYLSIVQKDKGSTAEENEVGKEDGDELSKKPSSGRAKSSGNALPSLEETKQLLHRKAVSGEDEWKGEATEEVATAVDEVDRVLFIGNDNEESLEEVAKRSLLSFQKPK